MRCYSKLSELKTFKERFKYLKLDSIPTEETFGARRYLNQQFYKSEEWKRIRDYVVLRDNGMDLGVTGFPIKDAIYVHHMNPITIEDLVERKDYILDPEFLISVSFNTHNMIHYSAKDYEPFELVERRPNDTCPWKE